ncbi:putative Triose-phosphate Transporter family [Leishmania naiffi]|uniref:Triose-phosphate Transporter family n=1 Tax=Leishmania naiffi TaxID=5678 RepID=A0AAW3BYX5_9TRYP
MSTEQTRILFYMGLNALSSIGIVYTNKVIFVRYGFTYGTLLTAIHFLITTLGLFICRMMGVFEPKRVPVAKILPLCLGFCGFVTLTNLSLIFNSIGFYQLTKVLTTPMLVVIQTLYYQKTFSTKVKLSLTAICIGVSLATVSDATANAAGTLIGLSALFITCMYQIWVGTKQKEFQCDSFQLLYNQASLSCAMLLPIAYFADDLAHKYYAPCWPTVLLIIFSGFLAFLVNISIFLVIGKTSPVTYNVLGHFKLCVILSLGFLGFGDPINARIFFGIIITLFGVVWYTHLNMLEAEKKEVVNLQDKHEEKYFNVDENDEKGA